MSIEWFRDLVVCIFGLVAAASLICIAVLALLIYRRIKPIMDSVKATSRTIEGISSRVENEVVKPVIEVVAIFKVVRQGIESISKLIKKHEGGKR